MLPASQPFAELEDRLAGLANLDESDADFLRDRIGELRVAYETLDFPLPPGVIHGDANVGNVILSRDGEPVLIDLDGFAVGPREWDLVQTALFYERFGWHTEEEYRTFVDVYGFDIMTWDGLPRPGRLPRDLDDPVAGRQGRRRRSRGCRGAQAGGGHQDRRRAVGTGHRSSVLGSPEPSC